MSCHCNKSISSCQSCLQQCNPCQSQSSHNFDHDFDCNSSCRDDCDHGCFDNRGCGCRDNRRCDCKKKKRRSYDEHKDKRDNRIKWSHSDEDDKSNRHHKRKNKQCNKCDRHDCDCVEFFNCLRTKCGFITACISKEVDPLFFTAAGQIIKYFYTITNTGTDTIKSPIQICDDKLGSQIIECVCIPPCESRVFTRTYTITAADLTTPSITNTATAFIKVKKRKWVITQQSQSTVTYGYADVFGSITQTPTGGTGALVTVSISNSAGSFSPAFGVSLVLPYPSGVTSSVTTAGAAISPANAVTVGSTGVSISQATIPIGATYQYQFTYGPVASGSYTWAGTIQTASFDPNPGNNGVTSTITL